LLREKIVFPGQEVDDQIANLLIAELLYLDSTAPGKDIYLYINSPGGLAYAGMAIYDTMQLLTSKVPTVCVGLGCPPLPWSFAAAPRASASPLPTPRS
jgi:ATP-dependent Clp protease protease subunit